MNTITKKNKNNSSSEERKENWKYIPQFDGYLQASCQGKIREFVQILKSDNKIHVVKNKVIKVNKNGRFSYNGRTFVASRYIFSAFYNIPHNGFRITYKDGNNQNRKPNNLFSEYSGPKADKSYNAKLSKTEVYLLCIDFINGFTGKALAEKYNIHFMNVYRVIRNDIWKSVERPKLDRKLIRQDKENLLSFFNSKINQNQ